jgi:TetR/AcrR family transcriptional repressor of nem operon
MSYQDLSDALGITKASIHYHFPSKADLLEALVRRYSEYFLGVVDRILASEGSGMGKLRRYCDLFAAKACPCGMLGAEAATLGGATLLRLRDFYAENDRRLRAMLEEGRRDGSVRFRGDAGDTAAVLFAALEGALMVARVRGGVEGFRAITGQLLRSLAP